MSSPCCLALPIGMISAVKQYSIFDQIATFSSFIGFSVPSFFTGLLLMLIFAVNLNWFPIVYQGTLEITDWETFTQQIRQMVLPITVLVVQQTAALTRFMRSAMLDNLSLDYVRTARAKGLTDRLVVVRHVLANSLIPVVTLIALGIPTIFAGAIITENLFRVNGLGQLLMTSINNSDTPVVMALTFIFAMLTVVFNLVADIMYGVLDPRVRLELASTPKPLKAEGSHVLRQNQTLDSRAAARPSTWQQLDNRRREQAAHAAGAMPGAASASIGWRCSASSSLAIFFGLVVTLGAMLYPGLPVDQLAEGRRLPDRPARAEPRRGHEPPRLPALINAPPTRPTCSAPTSSAATCSPAPCTAGGCRCWWASSPC